MTREDAKNIISFIEYGLHQDKNFNPYVLIDDIYDDFESRICENCKYLENGTFDNILYCSIDCSSNQYRKEKTVLKGFGCNLFRRKSND